MDAAEHCPEVHAAVLPKGKIDGQRRPPYAALQKDGTSLLRCREDPPWLSRSAPSPTRFDDVDERTQGRADVATRRVEELHGLEPR